MAVVTVWREGFDVGRFFFVFAAGRQRENDRLPVLVSD